MTDSEISKDLQTVRQTVPQMPPSTVLQMLLQTRRSKGLPMALPTRQSRDLQTVPQTGRSRARSKVKPARSSAVSSSSVVRHPLQHLPAA